MHLLKFRRAHRKQQTRRKLDATNRRGNPIPS